MYVIFSDRYSRVALQDIMNEHPHNVQFTSVPEFQFIFAGFRKVSGFTVVFRRFSYILDSRWIRLNQTHGNQSSRVKDHEKEKETNFPARKLSELSFSSLVM